MENNAIEIRAVTKKFGAVEAVKGVSFAVHRGEFFCLIGHNGAGKSTLFKMMLGIISPTSGDIFINQTLMCDANYREARRSIGYLPENVVFYDNLTGLETLRFFAKIKGADSLQCEKLLSLVGLDSAIHRRVRTYSKGMRQRLGLAQALLGDPSILFLDEPTSGLDPEAIREFYEILANLKSRGVTIILTSHILAEIQDRVDRLAIIKEGLLDGLGSVRELRKKIDLPIKFLVRFDKAVGLDGARKLAGQLGIKNYVIANEELTFKCNANEKMDMMGRVLASDIGVQDITTHEPSLEELFFGSGE